MAAHELSPASWRRGRGRWRVAAAAAVLAGLVAVAWLQRDALRSSLAAVEPGPLWLLPLGLFVLQAGISGLRTAVLLGPAAQRQLAGCLHCHLLAQLGNQVVPAMAGDLVVKSGCLARRVGEPLARVSGTVLLDRGFDAALAAALAPAALLLLTSAVPVGAAVALAGLAVIVLPGLAHAVLRPATTRIAARAARHGGRLAAVTQGLGALYDEGRPALLRAYGVTLLRFAAMAGGLGTLHVLVVGEPAWLTVALGASLVQLLLLVPLAPGGLGIVEGGWVAILVASGTAEGAALAFALGVRGYIVLGTLAAAGLGSVAVSLAPPRARRSRSA